MRYGSQVRIPGFHQTDCSISLRFRYMYERAIYMVNSFQFTRSRLILVYRRRKERYELGLPSFPEQVPDVVDLFIQQIQFARQALNFGLCAPIDLIIEFAA